MAIQDVTETVERQAEQSFDFEMLKADLLRIPASAWARASKLSVDHRLKGETRWADLYLTIANQLRDEGYAPNPDTGEMGPATKKHYSTGILGD